VWHALVEGYTTTQAKPSQAKPTQANINTATIKRQKQSSLPCPKGNFGEANCQPSRLPISSWSSKVSIAKRTPLDGMTELPAMLATVTLRRH
jgi:hypothetical protein